MKICIKTAYKTKAEVGLRNIYSSTRSHLAAERSRSIGSFQGSAFDYDTPRGQNSVSCCHLVAISRIMRGSFDFRKSSVKQVMTFSQMHAQFTKKNTETPYINRQHSSENSYHLMKLHIIRGNLWILNVTTNKHYTGISYAIN